VDKPLAGWFEIWVAEITQDVPMLPHATVQNHLDHRVGTAKMPFMPTKKTRPTNIDDYIAAAPKGAQKKLREIRACIRKAAPGATEGLKWSMPSFSYRRILVMFALHRTHIGFYPTPSAIQAFAKELSKFAHARGSVQFPLEKPLPLPLIRKITAFRGKESIEQDGKWRA
jgi:uncharacterized protein YdhG (YjbR/CyaY superfamily)